MPEQLTLLWLGTVALFSTFGGMAVSVPQYRQGESSFIGVIAYAFGLMFWLLYTVTSFNYFIVSNGETIAQSAETLGVAGLIGGIVTLILLFDAATRTLDIF